MTALAEGLPRSGVTAPDIDPIRALCHDLRQPLAAILLLSASGGGDVVAQAGQVILDQAQWLSQLVDTVLCDAAHDEVTEVDVAEVAEIAVTRARPTAACQLSVDIVGDAGSGPGPGGSGSRPGVRAGQRHPCRGRRRTRQRRGGAGQRGSVHLVISDDGPGLGKVASRTLAGADDDAGHGGGVRRDLPAPLRAERLGRSGRHLSRRGRRDAAPSRLRHEAGRLRRPPPAARSARLWPCGEQGHEVVALVASPGDAVDAVREHQPDVVLLDVNFPDGSSLARDPTDPGGLSRTTKVVMLSGRGRPRCGRPRHRRGRIRVRRQGASRSRRSSTSSNQAVNGHVAVDPALLQQALRHPEDQR